MLEEADRPPAMAIAIKSETYLGQGYHMYLSWMEIDILNKYLLAASSWRASLKGEEKNGHYNWYLNKTTSSFLPSKDTLELE